MTGITSVLLSTVLCVNINQEPPICPSRPVGKFDINTQQRRQLIAAPDNFYPEQEQPTPSPIPIPVIPAVTPVIPTPKPTVPASVPPLSQLTQADQIAAKRAWKYFERNWNKQTGLVNSGDNYPWTTWWDQGSALLGIHAARQLGLLPKELFEQRMQTLLNTLEKLPLPETGLPNKAYSTNTAEMRQLNNKPDPKGISGWSALDMGRFLLGLHTMRSHYPEYSDRINHIVSRWQLSKLVKDGWLNGGITGNNGKIREVQEGRLGYEQYAAHSLKLWNIQASNALYNPPVKTVQVDGITLQVDQRNQQNSNATNYLTNDPYLLWGLELGWTDNIKPQVQNLLKVQVKRFQRTGIITAVNEDSLDRPPYFLYYSVYSNGQSWQAVNSRGKSYPQLRFVSTKAAFSWFAIMPNEYTKKLRDFVQNLAEQSRGFFSGKYENSQLGINASVDVNTNAIVLESLLYRARGQKPIVLGGNK
ncbi:DUF3131 domain-containing protein [Nostoc sp. MS1]|uniref:DUF3131 domain-containing protein n=1 Tax=Nostoc sp. MS1 TaxID=2764711 RepID=UPI001CC60EDB|nr:DUF3131 domain-containing protein [Nostoc sp. MS1]